LVVAVRFGQPNLTDESVSAASGDVSLFGPKRRGAPKSPADYLAPPLKATPRPVTVVAPIEGTKTEKTAMQKAKEAFEYRTNQLTAPEFYPPLNRGYTSRLPEFGNYYLLANGAVRTKSSVPADFKIVGEVGGCPGPDVYSPRWRIINGHWERDVSREKLLAEYDRLLIEAF
jgi:hypothetical protein